MGFDGQQRFHVEEVEAILRRALKKRVVEGDITRGDLAETARELGISESELEDAIREEASVGKIERAKELWRVRRRQRFFHHLRSYATTNLFLFLIAMVTTGGNWYVYPLLFWGIFVAFDGAEAFNPKEKEVERGAARLLKKLEKRGQDISNVYFQSGRCRHNS